MTLFALTSRRIVLLGIGLAMVAAVRAQESSEPMVQRESGSNLASFADPAESVKDRRVALVIGNAGYTHISRLGNPVNDARDVCAALRGLKFDVVCFEDIPTRKEMKNVIGAFVDKLKAGGAGLFYYAGHGLQVKGENYIVPTAAALSVEADAEDETLSLNYLMNRLGEAKNTFNLVILDACRNNPLAKTQAAAREGGLAPVDAPPGSMVVYATAPGKAAIDGDGKGRNGIFTANLLRQLSRSGLTVEEMFKAVIGGVQTETQTKFGLQQIPWINSSYSGRFCFAGCEDSKMAQELDRIRREREELAKKAGDLDAQNQEREKKIEVLEAEVQRERLELQRRQEQIERDASTAGSSKKEADSQTADLRRQLEQLKTDYRKVSEQTEKLSREKSELESLKKKLADLEKEAAEVHQKNKQLVEQAHSTPTTPQTGPVIRSSEPRPKHVPPTF
jgi:hypothetical protein